MNYASIHLADCANGPGMRVSLFVSGCRHHCKGCFNKMTWDFNYGKSYTLNVERDIIRALERDEYDGLTILGGEPLDPLNQPYIAQLVSMVHWMGKSVWVYTGYTWEALQDPHSGCRTDCTDLILDMVDVLVDGPFIESEKDISLRFRGSRNQRIIDVQESLYNGEVTLWKE